MTDFALTYDSATGALDQSFGACATILNNIIISCEIKKGTWWHDPSFGIKDRPRAKNTERHARLVRQDYEKALQWLLDSGRATSIVVETWRDPTNKNRLNVHVTATQANGQVVTYTTFREVV